MKTPSKNQRVGGFACFLIGLSLVATAGVYANTLGPASSPVSGTPVWPLTSLGAAFALGGAMLLIVSWSRRRQRIHAMMRASWPDA